MHVNVRYCFSSEDGDLPADSATLKRPFLLSPSEPHPSLTLQDYFDAIQQVVLPFFTSLADQDAGNNAPEKIVIRSEKHGALYHVASAECFFAGRSRKVAVSTAVTGTARACMNREEALLRQLGKAFYLPYLPKVYWKRQIAVPGKQGLSVLLAEWFEDFHEWHFSGADGRTVSIWDRKNGNRPASPSQISGWYREISKILTLYYDPATFRRIGPWSHGAGDFIVKTEGEKVSVRLTTVRGYEPSPLFNPAENANPLLPFLYFFLELTLKMRLDRLNGTGEGVWADGFCLKPLVEGFFEALRFSPRQSRDLLLLLRGFDNREMQGLFQPFLSLYRQDMDQDLPLIEANAGGHADELWGAIRRFPG